MRSKVITISAISAGFISIFLALGIYVEIIDVFSLILCSAFVIMPLYLQSYKGAVISYLVGGVLGLIFVWFNFIYSFVFPAYFAFFGLYPIVNCYLKEKKIKRCIAHIIGLIWCVAAFYGIFFYYTKIMGLGFDDLPRYLVWIKDFLIYAVGVFGVIFYFIYDRFISLTKIIIDRYMGKIIK